MQETNKSIIWKAKPALLELAASSIWFGFTVALLVEL